MTSAGKDRQPVAQDRDPVAQDRAPVAQLVEHRSAMREVEGSNPDLINTQDPLK